MGLMGVFAFSSCKKDYKCVCKSTSDPAHQFDGDKYQNVSHKDAKTSCDKYEQQWAKPFVSDAECSVEVDD